MSSGRGESSAKLKRQRRVAAASQPRGVRRRLESCERALSPLPGLSVPQRLPGRGSGLLGPLSHRGVQREEDPGAGGEDQQHPEQPAAREVHSSPAGVRRVCHPCALSSRAEWPDLEGRAEAVALLCPAQPTASGRGASGSCSSPCVPGRRSATTLETECL